MPACRKDNKDKTIVVFSMSLYALWRLAKAEACLLLVELKSALSAGKYWFAISCFLYHGGFHTSGAVLVLGSKLLQDKYYDTYVEDLSFPNGQRRFLILMMRSEGSGTCHKTLP